VWCGVEKKRARGEGGMQGNGIPHPSGAGPHSTALRGSVAVPFPSGREC
jgi:hypothetical protein